MDASLEKKDSVFFLDKANNIRYPHIGIVIIKDFARDRLWKYH